MGSNRDDLDGLRLLGSGSQDVWLMFHGQRHLVADADVYDSLWSERDGLVHHDGLDEIPVGPPLGQGTCLIRAEGQLSIYLLTGWPGVRRHLVATWESLLDFGFDEGKARPIPPLALEGLALSGEISSAADRQARGEAAGHAEIRAGRPTSTAAQSPPIGIGVASRSGNAQSP